MGRALTPAMVFVGAGFLSAFLPGARPFRPQDHLALVEHVTELCVIVALMGVGLALDRPFSLKGWSSTWRLLLIAMPLFIALLGLAAWGLAGLAPGVALLLAAVVAPTDPVLAADVRVGEPTDDPDSEDELRFALSSEAGGNDGLAFPFVHASMLLLTLPAAEWLGGWVAWELIGKVVLGVACGVAIGYLFAHVAFRAPLRILRFAETAESVVSLAAVFLAYGVAELIGGYGFLSVFAAGLALRAQERGHEFHRTMHEFVTQVERLLTMGLLLVFGYSLGSGLLADLTWRAPSWGWRRSWCSVRSSGPWPCTGPTCRSRTGAASRSSGCGGSARSTTWPSPRAVPSSPIPASCGPRSPSPSSSRSWSTGRQRRRSCAGSTGAWVGGPPSPCRRGHLWLVVRRQSISASTAFFSALGWVGLVGAFGRSSSMRAPISRNCARLNPARTWGNHSCSSSSMW